MTRSLCSKFMLRYLTFGLLGSIAIATFSSKMTRDYLIQSKTDTLYDEANIIASSYSTMYQGKRLDSEEVSTQMRVLSRHPRAEIQAISRQGTVVMNSLGDSRVQSFINGFDPVSIGNQSYTIGDYYGIFSGNVPNVPVPITGNYNTYGYVLIRLPIGEINQSQNGILSTLYIISAVLFGLPLIILLVSTQTVRLPLRKITVGANEYAVRNLGYQIDAKTRDKMGYLSDTLNYTSDELNKMEEYQGNLIANVSHDFRSPLISTKGYLEVILNDTISAEVYERYLSGVISETERLHKLTEGIFTPNSLDAKGYLSRTDFDTNCVIKDTAASSEGICESKNVSSDLIFSDDIQMVFADLGKIQQIMYNLTDNAIKFSHHDSTIYIQASGRYEEAFVLVGDTDIGIPKNSPKKIWKHFYKTDLSRGKDRRGIGLGLSIAKEIIQTRGKNIDVASTEGAGTGLIFSLPRSANPWEMSVAPDLRSLWECSSACKCPIISQDIYQEVMI